VPFALALYAGRVDLKDDGDANYGKKPKLTKLRSWTGAGVQPGAQVRSGAVVMCLTCVSYGMDSGVRRALRRGNTRASRSERDALPARQASSRARPSSSPASRRRTSPRASASGPSRGSSSRSAAS